MRSVAAWLDRWHWLWLGLAAPLLLFPGGIRVLGLAVVPGLWLLAWRAGVNPLPDTPLNLALLFLYCGVAVSLGATYDVVFSLPKIAGLVLALGVFFALAREGRPVRGWWAGLGLFLAIGAGIAAAAMIGTRWEIKFTLLAPLLERLPPPMMSLPGAEDGFNPNAVAGTLLWVIPAAASLAFWTLTRRVELGRVCGERGIWAARLGSLGLLSGLTGVLVLTQSRSAYLALTLTAVAGLLGYLLWTRRFGWVAGLGAATLAGAAGLAWLTAADVFRSVSVLQGRFLLDMDSGREAIWARALVLVQAHPLTGIGLNTFRVLVQQVEPHFNSYLLLGDIAHAHNEFLQAALDLGLPGLVAFVAVHGLALGMAGRVVRQAAARWQSYLAAGLALGLIAHLGFGQYDAVALGAKTGVLFWMNLGLITGLFLQTTAGRPADA